MNTKTVKEKVEKIMVDYMRNPNSNSLYVPVKVLDKIDKLYRKEMLKELPKEKKILWPLNGCRKDCKICKIEVENWNSCLREAKKVLFYNK